MAEEKILNLDEEDNDLFKIDISGGSSKIFSKILPKAISGSLRDSSFIAENVTSILSVLTGPYLLSSTTLPPLPSPARSIFDVSIAILSFPEVIQSRELRRVTSDFLLTTPVIDSILRRLVICSETLSTNSQFPLGSSKQTSQKVLPGLVTVVSSSSSSSSSSASYFFSKSNVSAIESTRSRRGPCRGAYQSTLSFLATKDSNDPSIVSLSVFDELSYIKALLYFLYELSNLSIESDSIDESIDVIKELQVCSTRRFLVLSRCESFLINVGRDPSPVVSLAVEVVLGFVAARFRGEHDRDATLDRATPLRYFQNSESIRITEFTKETLLHRIFLPLHSMPGMASDTSASLSCFHETLTSCMTLLLSSEYPVPFSSLLLVISRLVELLPSESHQQSNDQSQHIHFGSAHTLLILHGIDSLIKSASSSVLPRSILSKSMWLIMDKILPFCISDSSREAQKALSFFRIQSFVNFAVTELDISQLSRLISVLAFRSKNWNLTVNRMSAAASRALYTENENRVLEAVILLNSSSSSIPITNVRPSALVESKTIPTRRSLKSGVVSSSGNLSDFGTATGVQPAIVTGVAPWAKLQTQPSSNMRLPPPPSSLSSYQGLKQLSQQEPVPSKHEPIPSQQGSTQIQAQTTISTDNNSRFETAKRRFESALLELSPSALTVSSINPTIATALSKSPVLLPSLSFQDLVFGHELGSGSFSTVRYAKLIRKGLPASQWPEYAVKVISTQTIVEMGYELAVRREIAVLSTLTHPNVTRLASAFRWRDGAFLVLEFCSGGDLQKLLSEVGSLGEDAAKFLMAEVCSGIHHIHSKGLAYGDCKPENIVLVGTGTGDARNESVGLHAKITDFAACRPFNSHGSQIMSNAINIIKNLRDGDWRAQHGLAEASGMHSTILSQTSSSILVPSETIDDTDVYDKEDDDRIEGTLEYLAPELASKRCQPSIATDAYAFGVTLFKVLTGELPNVEEIQSSSTTIISSHSKVRFGGEGGGVTEGLFPLGFPPLAAKLVTQLLSTDPNERLTPKGDFLSILNHPWFTEKNESFRGKTAEEIVNGDLASLPAPLVQNGLRGPPPDPAWSRRHNSTMWAPLPKEYQTLSPSQSLSQSTGKDIKRGKKSPTLLDFTNSEPDAIIFKLLNV